MDAFNPLHHVDCGINYLIKYSSRSELLTSRKMMELLKLIEPVQGQRQLRVSMALLNFRQGQRLFRKKSNRGAKFPRGEKYFPSSNFSRSEWEKNCKNSLLSKSWYLYSMSSSFPGFKAQHSEEAVRESFKHVPGFVCFLIYSQLCRLTFWRSFKHGSRRYVTWIFGGVTIEAASFKAPAYFL